MKRALLILCILAASITSITADSYCLNALDEKVAEWTADCRYRSMDCFMTRVSEAWNPENLVLASLPIIVYGDERAFRCLELSWKSLLISETATAALKLVTNRHRPDGEPHSRSNSSFPSSHASSSFAVAYSVSTYYPRFSLAAYGVAALISYSRVYLDAHHPSDVIVGAGVGIVGGYVAARYLGSRHTDRAALLERLPVRVQVGDGLGSIRVYFTRRM